ncbi:hypothetical protein PT974_00140 [Cladobotryum mycophilum]|uniref:Leucine rich repeat domain containing protein n=1 Tax=Cladobotryum mycophilum TaxID=491253 RepID=A0ABR0T083_9HYPO
MTALGLPSYREATARPDWLQLASSHVSFADYRALCLVDRRFWRLFAPRLWANLLGSARLSGLASGYDLDWWLDFVFNKLARVAPATRALVHVLDARDFAKDGYHFASDQTDRTLGQSFKRALELLPNVESLLLDGHADADPGFLADLPGKTKHLRLRLLSISYCSTQLSSSFFHSSCLQSLVLLDVSGLPGSIRMLLHPSILPDLRILKVRNREIDDRMLRGLANSFKRRLWSLDLSDNKVTDAVIQPLTDNCFPVSNLRSAAHFQVEGKLVSTPYGTPHYGPFIFIEDSSWSASFNHPERYLADAPLYMAVAGHGEQENHVYRSDCRPPPRQDSADAFVQLSPYHSDVDFTTDQSPTSRGLTHLSLSNNQVSAFGVEKLIHLSNGQLEYFACDRMPLFPVRSFYPQFWPRSAKLYGIFGMEYIFRPLFSSNLRAMRIHHSLVTNIPTLEMAGLSSLARAFLSETSIMPRIEEAFPLTFVPDTNPRLASLTLTCIPRRSSGPLIRKLVAFLKLLSIQEHAVQETRKILSSWRAPEVLPGLRHLRLEFEPDTMEDALSGGGDLDAEALMNSGDRGFSFFDDAAANQELEQMPNHTEKVAQNSNAAKTERRAVEQDGQDFVTYHGEWNGKKFSVPVWTGCEAASPNAVIDAYRRLIAEQKLHDGVGPVTPSQVRAGVPEKSYIFHTAWYMAIMPQGLRTPSHSDLAGMKDVMSALRDHRLSGRVRYAELERHAGKERVPPGEPHFFWRGRLEVLT